MKVVNIRKAAPGSFVYIGRKNFGFEKSEWSNSFIEGVHGSREEVIRKYKVWLWKYMKSDPQVCKRLLLLDGKDLGCWCAPLPCHGDVLIAAVEWIKKQS